MINHLIMFFSVFAAASASAAVGGCEPSDFVTKAGNVAVNLVGMEYTPRCLRVKSGSVITLPGNKRHPIQGGDDVNGVTNPFRIGAAATDQIGKTLNVVGYYIYYCVKHGDSSGGGMSGVVEVVE